MKKFSVLSTLATIVLCACAVVIMVRTLIDRVIPEIGQTTCEQKVFPLIIEEIRSERILRSYRYENMVTVGDTISGSFGSRLGMEITYHLALDCIVDLGDISAKSVEIAYEEGIPVEITVHLPQPTYSPVEILETIESRIYTRNSDNTGESIALMREYLFLEAKSEFQMDAIQANVIGRGRQSAAETIRNLVEAVLADQGISVAITVVFVQPVSGIQSPAGREDYSNNRPATQSSE
jgi:hypothetical protein